MELSKVKEVLRREFKGKAITNGLCEYKTDKGLKCAIGCFIPEGHEGALSLGGVKELLREHVDLKEYMPHENVELLRDWQYFHDRLNKLLTVDKQRYFLYKEFLRLRRIYAKRDRVA